MDRLNAHAARLADTVACRVYRFSAKEKYARIRSRRSREQTNKRRLPRTVITEERHNFSFAYLQIGMTQCLHRAKRFP